MTNAPSTKVRRYSERIAARWRDVASSLSLQIVAMVSLAIVFPLNLRALGPEIYGQYTVIYLISGLVGLWISAAPTAALSLLILQLERNSDDTLHLARRLFLLCAGPAAVLGTLIASTVSSLATYPVVRWLVRKYRGGDAVPSAATVATKTSSAATAAPAKAEPAAAP